MRTRQLVGPALFLFGAVIASGTVAAQATPAAPSTAETSSAAQVPTERQPSDGTPEAQAPAAGEMAAPTATAGDPAAAPIVTTDGQPAATPATATAAVTDFGGTHPGDAAAGESKAGVCGACHGLDGNSADPQYPKLAGQNELYIARQLALYKSGERANPIMQPMATPLSAQDMRDIGAFFATKQAMPGLANDAKIAAGGDETWAHRGQQLFRGGNAANGTPACMACHGPSGRGNPGSRYPALAGQHADYTKLQLEAFRAGTVHGTDANANAVMAGVAKSLSDQDIEALATYIEGLHRRPVAQAKPGTGEAAR